MKPKFQIQNPQSHRGVGPYGPVAKIVVVGASLGGYEALKVVLSALPEALFIDF
jgi:chemotaxis response regulator CheB